MKVMQFPIVRITIWLVLGILFSYSLNLKPKIVFGLLFAAVVIFTISYFIVRKKNQLNPFFGIMIYFLTFSIGAFTQVIHNGFYHPDNYIHQLDVTDKEHNITIVVREKLKENDYCQRYIATVKSIDNKSCSGKIALNFYKNDLVENFTIGSIIYLKGKIIQHQKPKNPDQFDYGNYLTRKSIFAQMFVSNFDYNISPKIDKNIWYYANAIRSRILTNLKNNGFHQQELNVVAALILGQKQDLSPEILQDYQFAGAIHILSVSGLHVGYLFLFISFLLGGLPKSNAYNYLKLSIILFTLWSFAVLAGLSPSVVRSVTMFSIIAIGSHLKSRTNIYNTLCVSMFFILLFEPAFLFDVGFQLSYAAVFFIVWLFPIISKIWTPRYKIIKYLWEIMAVSFAAQIGTLPLSLYYFHQFPSLFFITNMVVLPVLGFIMILGIVVMIFAVVNYIPEFLSKTLEISITLLNNFIHWIASFRGFIIKDIPLNGILLFSLYLVIIMTFVWLSKPNNSKLKLVLVSVLLMQCAYFKSVWNQKESNELIVFNQKKKTIIGAKNGEKALFITNDTIINSSMIKSYLVASFNPSVEQKQIENLLYFNKKKMLVIDQTGVYPKIIKPDIILITKSPKINFERMLLDLKPKIVIADASNYKTAIQKWKVTCSKEKIPFHATSEKGFYKLN